MIIQPRIKGFLCTTAHPVGCAEDVARQIAHVRGQGPVKGGPDRVLIIGASGGYGLATRITAAFGCNAATIGLFFERQAARNRTASSGWYKSAAFTNKAEAAGLYARNINGDAFSDDVKQRTIALIKEEIGQVDMVVYSLAAPSRTLPDGTVARSTLKPIGKPFTGVTLDINSSTIRPISLDPATGQEVSDTVRVMGGEDWEIWIQALLDAGVLADGCITTNYTYLGSEVTWPIYYHGTIGRAKEDLDRAVQVIHEKLSRVDGSARVVVMKGLLTGASSAIPGMSLYLSLLYKAMKSRGIHEGCIEQTTRLFTTQLFNGNVPEFDEAGRIRMDDWELSETVQSYVMDNWSIINESNLSDLTDFAGYREAFLQLHGFGFNEVDYQADVEQSVDMALVE